MVRCERSGEAKDMSGEVWLVRELYGLRVGELGSFSMTCVESCCDNAVPRMSCGWVASHDESCALKSPRMKMLWRVFR